MVADQELLGGLRSNSMCYPNFEDRPDSQHFCQPLRRRTCCCCYCCCSCCCHHHPCCWRKNCPCSRGCRETWWVVVFSLQCVIFVVVSLVIPRGELTVVAPACNLSGHWRCYEVSLKKQVGCCRTARTQGELLSRAQRTDVCFGLPLWLV